MEFESGKSFSRRYFEDMLERFETEAKYITNKEELEKKRLKLSEEIKAAFDSNVLSAEHLKNYLERLRNIKIKNQFSIEELKYIVSDLHSIKGESCSDDKQDINLDMSTEKDLRTKIKEKDKER